MTLTGHDHAQLGPLPLSLTDEQADRLVRIARDRLGMGFKTLGLILGWDRTKVERRYWRAKGSSFYRRQYAR